MAIMVMYDDKSTNFVRNKALEKLIKSGSIFAFKRSDGWVEVSKGPLRGQGPPVDYRGPERRHF